MDKINHVLREIEEEWKRDNLLEMKVIPTYKIMLGKWVRMKCQYGCENFKKSWSCPPAVPNGEDVRKALMEYKYALLLRFRTTEVEELKKLQRPMLYIEKKLLNSGFYKVFSLFPGACAFCKSCVYPKKCKFPGLSRPSIESFGIDMFMTARNCGIDLEMPNGNGTHHSMGIILLE